MKLRDLMPSRRGGSAVWPGRWVVSARPGDPSAVPEDGVLEGLTRLGGRLLLQINVNGQRRTASLEWDPPPRVGDVEMVLLASIGAKIRDLGNLEVPAGPSHVSPMP